MRRAFGQFDAAALTVSAQAAGAAHHGRVCAAAGAEDAAWQTLLAGGMIVASNPLAQRRPEPQPARSAHPLDTMPRAAAS